MAYSIEGICVTSFQTINTSDDVKCDYIRSSDSLLVQINGSCNPSPKGDNYVYYSHHSPSCYLSDSYKLGIPLIEYNQLIGLSGLLYGFLFFGVVLYTLSFIGRK